MVRVLMLSEKKKMMMMMMMMLMMMMKRGKCRGHFLPESTHLPESKVNQALYATDTFLPVFSPKR